MTRCPEVPSRWRPSPPLRRDETWPSDGQKLESFAYLVASSGPAKLSSMNSWLQREGKASVSLMILVRLVRASLVRHLVERASPRGTSRTARLKSAPLGPSPCSVFMSSHLKLLAIYQPILLLPQTRRRQVASGQARVLTAWGFKKRRIRRTVLNLEHCSLSLGEGYSGHIKDHRPPILSSTQPDTSYHRCKPRDLGS